MNQDFDTRDDGDEHVENHQPPAGVTRLEIPVIQYMERDMSAVIKRDEASVAMLAEFQDLMDTTPVDRKDFLIPKLLLMQSMTKLVQEEKARVGEIRGSIDQNKIADKGGAIEIIPFAVYKTWVTLSKQGSEFLGQEPITPQNCNWPREQVKDGVEVSNFETLNYYCLLPEEIRYGMFMPYVVSFRSTSYQAGKTLETHRARLQEFGKPLPFKTFWLGSLAKKNDKGNFYVFTIAESRDTLEEELNAVKHWHKLVKQGEANVDETEFTKVEPAFQASASAYTPQDTRYDGDEF